jgi:hypothetical protein
MDWVHSRAGIPTNSLVLIACGLFPKLLDEFLDQLGVFRVGLSFQEQLEFVPASLYLLSWLNSSANCQCASGDLDEDN